MYPFFPGRTEAEQRLYFIHNGANELKLLATIIHTELAKAEDTLRAYRQSLGKPAESRECSELPIHRFFHTRVADNAMFHEFYNTGIKIHEILLPLPSFLSMSLEINGVHYPSLDEISGITSKNLHPMATTSCPTAFGLGDAHGANIIAEKREPNNTREMLYIDYEVAGYHSVMLDLAKPFYNDIFFQRLYADNIKDPSNIVYELKDGVIRITLGACRDQLGQAILEIKRRFLIAPLFEHAKGSGHDLEQHISQLASALFTCACLTRNFNGDWDTLFRNLAVGVMFSQVKSMTELWLCCGLLGM